MLEKSARDEAIRACYLNLSDSDSDDLFKTTRKASMEMPSYYTLPEPIDTQQLGTIIKSKQE